MFKWVLVGLLAVAMPSLANDTLDKKWIGKWQCHIKSQEALLEQSSQVQFFANGSMREDLHITYGQKGSYEYQIETATAQATWRIQNEMITYDNYKIGRYAVRMPNADKYDVEQAHIAVQKSLPIIEAMMNNQVGKRQFDVSFINKRTVMMNDVNNQQFVTCHKKGLF